MAIEWKKVLKEVFIKLNIVEEGFTGQIIVNFSQGGIANCEYRKIIK